jgi:transposase
MARAGPRKVQAYSREFKLTAVRLSQQPGIQVQGVAAALDIHPFMLSKWRKDVRDGVLRGRGRNLRVPPLREIRRLQELERAHALLQEEHALLKKPSGSVPSKEGHLRVHRHAAGGVRADAAVRALRGDARGLLRVAAAAGERACGAGPEADEAHHRTLPRAPGAVREPADPPGTAGRGVAGEPSAGSATHADGGVPGPGGAGLSGEPRPPSLLRAASEPAPAGCGAPAQSGVAGGRHLPAGGPPLAVSRSRPGPGVPAAGGVAARAAARRPVDPRGGGRRRATPAVAPWAHLSQRSRE